MKKEYHQEKDKKSVSGKNYPLTHGQKGIWFLTQLAPDSRAYNVVYAAFIRPDINPDHLQKALTYLARRHRVLNTFFQEKGSEIIQTIPDVPCFDLTIIDASSWSESRLDQWIEDEADRPFDLTQGPLASFTLLNRHDNRKHLERIFLVTMHHIISDHESLQIFMEDLADAFEAIENGHEPNLPTLETEYSDFVTWHNNLVESAKGQQHQLYWKNQLKGELPVLNLPVDKPRPAVQTFSGAIQLFWLEEPLCRRIRDLSRDLSCSLYTTLLHIFEVFLYKQTGQAVFLVGSATSLRRKEAFKRLLGYCVNPFVLRADLTGNPRFDELVQRSRENLHAALANSEYPFPLVVETLQANRELSHATLFQATFNLIREQSKAWPWSEQNGNGFLNRLERLGQRGASFDLLLSAIEVQDRLRLEWTYNTDLFDEATICRMHRQFQALLDEILKAPDTPVNAISMMTPGEKQRLLTELNRTDTDYPKDQCIHHLFQAYAEKTPTAVALCFGSRPMTYGQLDGKAERMAHHLSSLGAVPGSIVGLCMERSLDMVIGLLAILKSGSSYLPLDSEYPDDRISFMLADSSAGIVLTQERFLKRMNNLAPGQCKIIPVEQIKALSDNGQKINSVTNPAANPKNQAGPENSACIIYTSGSTGKPKGVVITHRNIIRLVKNCLPITFSQDNRQLLHTPISFDASFMEIWGSLLNGAFLEIMPPGPYASFEMGKIVREKAISQLFLTTALFNIIIDENPGDFEGLKLLAFGGESASIPHTNKALEQLKHTRIFNVYGPTENTTSTTAYQITEKLITSVPIGKPISNTRVYLLDTQRQPVPTGVTGELYLGGDGVARGYHGRPVLTRERFIPDPFADGPDHRLYKTGDLARYLPDGNLVFIGRIDNQVKIRGYRIEMGEIEHALASFPGIRTSFVDIKEDKERGKYLVAYLVSKDGANIDESRLKDYLGNRLPAYMVPGVFIFMASFPLSPSNKIDRNALPEPKIGPDQQAYVPPSHPLEKQLCAIWKEVFNCRGIGINTNFFSLGGHSLMAARLLSRIKEATGIALPLKSIFKSPTIKELRTLIATIQAEPGPSDAVIEITGGNGQNKSILSFGQQRLWFISQMDENASSYNMPFALRLNGALDRQALKQALNEIVNRHDILRSTIINQSGVPRMKTREKWELPLPIVGLGGEDLALVNAEAWRPFSLSKGPLIRATLFEKNTQDHILLITFHHIVADGWSMDIFMGELGLLYDAFIKGNSSPLKPLPLQFQDFATWERRWFTSKVHDRLFTYWKKHLEGAPQYLDLPIDRIRPPVQTDRGRAEQFSLDPFLTAAIQKICRQEQTSLFTFFYTAFVLLLSRYSGQKDIVLGVPVANRDEKQIDSLIGFFTNTLALRLDVSKASHFLELLKQSQDVVLDGFTHQAMPFERLVEALKIPRSMDRTPLFQVMFSMEEFQSWKKATLSNLDIQPILLENRVAKFDLTLSLSKTDQGITGEFEFNQDLFDAWRIRAMADHFTMLLTAIVDGPQKTMGMLDILTREEKDQILARTIGAPGDRRLSSTKEDISRRIEQQAILTPQAPALVCEDETMTYAQINRAVNHLAHYLKSLGVRPDDAVGVCLDKSLEAVTAMLAILKAGGVYVPMDPDLPDQRLIFMIEDSNLKVLMAADRSILQRLLKSGSTIIPVLTTDLKTGSQEETEFTGQISDPVADPIAGPDNLAYIIYTSGTTGRPKGVEITRGAITAHSLTMQDYFALTPGDRVLQFSALSFDTSLEQILPTLMAGACLFMRGKSLWTINDFRHHLVEGGLTVADLPPSYLLQVLTEWAGQPGDFQQNTLRLLICGGEPMPFEVVKLWRQIMGKSVRLINAYGPTEATITAMVCDAAKALPEELPENIPIGRPLANRRALILDDIGNLVPPGVFGELYLGGSGLARGYRNLPEQTRNCFVRDPFSSTESRLYKTGDRAQYLPDGSIAFWGRMDSQIKIRGFRIEPMEVTSALLKHKAVQACIVVDRPDNLGTNSLFAYIIPKQEGKLPVSAIRSFLAKQLPEYMVPSTVIEMKSFPLTPNGKIDLSRLPATAQDPAGGKIPIARAMGEAEQKIARLWQELLGVETVGIHHNFFDLGGHSLLMIKLQSELTRQFDKEISIVDLFAHPTIHRLAKFITGNQELDERHLSTTKDKDTDIAVIGMALRVPGATSIDTFWENLCNGVESVTFFTDEELAERGVPRKMLDNPAYVKAGGILDNPGFFDAEFFGYTPMEARQMDPQHRKFLECAWEALEHAGYDAERIKVPVGVFAGSGMNTYLLNNLNPGSLSQEQLFQVGMNNDKDFLSSRISYQMNLTGPAVTVQTACSTSLVAVNMACRSLETKDCEMALAGGITIMAKQDHGYLYQEGMIMSPDGHCRAFDANACGTVGGNGAGIVVLKRLDQALCDGDTVYAVIKGSAINNDGSVKASYAAPGIQGQSRVVSQALARSGIPPETIGYIECHGTGTRLGDPIEIGALKQVFNRYTTKKKFCALGSVKTNIGHLDTAAGITGFIKTVLAINRGVIPPSLHFETPNPEINFEDSPFYVNQSCIPWSPKDYPRRAGVSSFGIGGTNAHVVLEQSIPPEVSSDSPPRHLMIWSAKTPQALDRATGRLAGWLKNATIRLADAAYTLAVGRRQFPYRRMFVCSDCEDAVKALEETGQARILQGKPGEKSGGKKAGVTFLFPGQGSPYVNMAQGLYHEVPLFQQTADHCFQILLDWDLDLADILFPGPGKIGTGQLNETALAQPALFVIEYALAQLWIAWGVTPSMMMGHSLGEYTAACLAGVMTLKEALGAVVERGRLMQQLPGGVMVSVPLSPNEVQPFLRDGVALAAHNTPSQCVLSCPIDKIQTLETKLGEQKIEFLRLHTSHAFHSRMMDPMLENFRRVMDKIDLKPPCIPYISNVSGTWITAEEATNPDYWVSQIRNPVKFSQGLDTLLGHPENVLVETGPGRTLTNLSKQHRSMSSDHLVLNSIRHPKDKRNDLEVLFTCLGQLWLAGVDIDWNVVYGQGRFQRIALPTYPFEKQNFWIEPETRQQVPTAPAENKKNKISEWFYHPVWKPMLPVWLPEKTLPPLHWLLFEEKRGLGKKLAQHLAKKKNQETVMVCMGPAFRKIDDHTYEIRPDQEADYHALIKGLDQTQLIPDRIIHLWNVTGTEPRTLDKTLTYGFYSLLYLAKALAFHAGDIELIAVSNNMQSVYSNEITCPQKAVLLGPIKVIGKEYTNFHCRSIDLMDAPNKGDKNEMETVDRLFQEIINGPPGITALRGDYTWTQSYEPLSLGSASDLNPALKNKGVTLITGGLGGLGLTLAGHLATKAQSRLVLVGRSVFPARKEWDNWLSRKGSQDRTSRKINALKTIEKLGSKILILQADVGEKQQMQAVLDRTLKQFGTLNGVIHAAGVPEGALIARQDASMADPVLKPKIQGLMVLDDLLEGRKLDFFILCSSLTSVVGEPGQIGYTAANAFLDAFAHHRTAMNLGPMTALNWDTWQQTGMAQDSADALGKPTQLHISREQGPPLSRPLSHSLFDRIVPGPQRTIYISQINTTRWFLNEHRINGTALLPGTAFLELAWEAAGHHTGKECVELRQVCFFLPLIVGEGQNLELQTSLITGTGGLMFEISTLSGSAGRTLHAGGEICFPEKSRERHDLKSIREMCNKTCLDLTDSRNREHKTAFETDIEQRFGPRWHNLKTMYLGNNQALARLELPGEFNKDMEAHSLHPALLDIAAGFLSIHDRIPGLPFSYDSLTIRSPLPPKFFSHIRRLDTNTVNSGMTLYDVTLMDDNGIELVKILGYALRDTQKSPLNALFHQALEAGILPSEGAEVFDRAIRMRAPQLIISTRDLDAVIREGKHQTLETLATRLESSDPASVSPRPHLSTDYTPPSNGTETALADTWKYFFGIETIGIHDDFFELGGDSLLAVQLVTRIREKVYPGLSTHILLASPTVAALAEHIRAKKRGTQKQPSPLPAGLIPIQEGRPERIAMFMIHPVGGTVYMYRHLAKALGPEQPLYAIQSRGLDGREPPLESIIEMATYYIRIMETHQPDPPYYIGGASMGGMVAFEMARQLLSQDKKVASLVMIDSAMPRQGERPSEDDAAELYSYVLHLGVSHSELSLDELKRLDPARQITCCMDRGKTSGWIPQNWGVEQFQASFSVFKANSRAMWRYLPGDYPGKILFFKAREKNFPAGTVFDQGWKELARDGIEVIEIPGNHFTMNVDPGIRIIGQRLKNG